MPTSKDDPFGSEWAMTDDERVMLAVVKSARVVAMKTGNVAIQIETPAYHQPDTTEKLQAILSPDYARKLGASLIEAANMVSKGDG